MLTLLDGHLSGQHYVSILERCPFYRESTTSKRSEERQGSTVDPCLNGAYSYCRPHLNEASVHLIEVHVNP